MTVCVCVWRGSGGYLSEQLNFFFFLTTNHLFWMESLFAVRCLRAHGTSEHLTCALMQLNLDNGATVVYCLGNSLVKMH